MNFDLNVIATGLAAPCAVFIIKTLLDFSLSHYFVKYLHWIPVRGLFRERPPAISGKWEQIWEAPDSPSFKDVADRHSYTDVKQFGKYLYAEFYAKGKTYCMFATIKNSYVTGEWYDKSDRLAYFGNLQLKIVDAGNMSGLYIGHSSRTSRVACGDWSWRRCSA